MLVNTALMLVYVTKFFWWEAGYWNTMDIAHDRGLHVSYSCFCWTYLLYSFVLLFCTFEARLLKEKISFWGDGGCCNCIHLKPFFWLEKNCYY